VDGAAVRDPAGGDFRSEQDRAVAFAVRIEHDRLLRRPGMRKKEAAFEGLSTPEAHRITRLQGERVDPGSSFPCRLFGKSVVIVASGNGIDIQDPSLIHVTGTIR
jgi:hypothetical protein